MRYAIVRGREILKRGDASPAAVEAIRARLAHGLELHEVAPELGPFSPWTHAWDPDSQTVVPRPPRDP